MENKQEEIDLGKLLHIMYDRRKLVGMMVGGCTLLAFIIASLLPKTYDSTTLVQTRGAGLDGASAMAAMMGLELGGGSSKNSPVNYIEMMKSRAVLEPVIDLLEWEDENRKPTAKGFAKEYLKIENTKQTNLITVTATAKTPEEAQKISQGVVDNFLALQTDMNQQTQSTMIKFLGKRIDEAKKEAEEARTKFAEYQQEHMIYSPDEQAKAIVSRMSAYDEALANMGVQERASQAKLDAVTEKLGDIRSSSLAYNINDNDNVVALRKKIVDAQVDLVGLREHYTEEHPSVISAVDKLAALEGQLTELVNVVVASKYTSMNPTQAAMVGEQANAQVSLAVAEASEAAIKERKAEKEKELEGFPRAVLEYMSLQRDSVIKEEIYTNLVKQSEQNKIKEAMESMDIQIIDPADLPDEDRPSGPRKKLITAVGFVIGCLISFGYGLVCYKREEA